MYARVAPNFGKAGSRIWRNMTKTTAYQSGKCKTCAAFRGQKEKETCRAVTSYGNPGENICPWLYEINRKEIQK
jgi:hypothetical protein